MDMEFNVASLLKENVGATRTIEFGTPSLLLSEPTTSDEPELIAADVHGTARLTRLKGRLRLNGKVEATVELTCSRCLEPFTTEVKAPLEEIYQQTVDVTNGLPLPQDEYAERDPDDFSIDNHHVLDMTDATRQALLVSLPMQPLCREDCRGFCPTCGKNLNEGDCDCTVEVADPRFAALAALLVDEDTVERISKN